MYNPHLKQVLALSLFLLIAPFSFTACNQPNKDPSDAYGTKSKDSADNLNRTKFKDPLESRTAKYISTLYLNSLYSTVLSQKALERHLHQPIKSIAGYQVKEHKLLNKELKHIASVNNISLPANISNQQQMLIKQLEREKGLNYESDYINKIILVNKDIYMTLQETKKSSDDDIRTWSQKNIPIIQTLSDTLVTGRKLIDSLQIKAGLSD